MEDIREFLIHQEIIHLENKIKVLQFELLWGDNEDCTREENLLEELIFQLKELKAQDR